MSCDAKKMYLQMEGDAYFERNLEAQKVNGATKGVRLFDDFVMCQVDGGGYVTKDKKVLEVGCCYGYNLAYLESRYDFKCYGIEPSKKAVSYGNQIFKDKIIIKQGTADELTFEDNFFDVVIVGTCLCQVDRILLANTLTEIDRVLRNGGFLVINDFDTPFPCRRDNRHNTATPVFKDNYGEMFLHRPYNYSLVEKRTYDFGGSLAFPVDVQERVSTQILYKEKEMYYFFQ